jgi:hypothetical protein
VGDEAHVLVSTTAATNIIADTLVARQDLIDSAPETVRDFVHGWFLGIEMMRKDPASSYAVVGKALKLDNETVSGMLSGLKLTPFADNAQFYGLTGGRAHYETLFDTAFVIWRKKGLVTRAVAPPNGRIPASSPRWPPPTRARRSRRRRWRPRPPPPRTAPSSTSRSRSTSRPAPTRSCPARTSSSMRWATP